MGLKAEDIIQSINGKEYTIDAISEMMDAVQKWKEGDTITMKIKRNNKEQTLTGKAIIPINETRGYGLSDQSKKKINEAWLKG